MKNIYYEIDMVIIMDIGIEMNCDVIINGEQDACLTCVLHNCMSKRDICVESYIPN